MLHLTTDTIYSFSFDGVAVIFTLQNHVTSMYSCRGDKVRYTCRQASSFFPMKWPTMMILQVAVHKEVARIWSSWRIWMGLQQHRLATPWVRWVRRCGETRPTRTRWATLRPEWPGWIFGSLLQAMDPSKQSCKESQVHTKGNLQRLQLISDLFYTSFQGFVKNLILGGQLIISPLEQLYVSCL